MIGNRSDGETLILTVRPCINLTRVSPFLIQYNTVVAKIAKKQQIKCQSYSQILDGTLYPRHS